MKKLLMVCVVVGLLATGAAQAAVTTLDFTELPVQPVDGLSYMGVTFGFTIGGAHSADARYHSGGPGVTTFVQDPSLEGDATGILTLDFTPQPTNQLQFGVVLNNFAPMMPGFTVDLPGEIPAGQNDADREDPSTSNEETRDEGEDQADGPNRYFILGR